MVEPQSYPLVRDPSLVGTYPALAKSGGGFTWDAVLEYRVWCSPAIGALDEADGSGYFFSFDTYEAAKNALGQALEKVRRPDDLEMIVVSRRLQSSVAGATRSPAAAAPAWRR